MVTAVMPKLFQDLNTVVHKLQALLAWPHLLQRIKATFASATYCSGGLKKSHSRKVTKVSFSFHWFSLHLVKVWVPCLWKLNTLLPTWVSVPVNKQTSDINVHASGLPCQRVSESVLPSPTMLQVSCYVTQSTVRRFSQSPLQSSPQAPRI